MKTLILSIITLAFIISFNNDLLAQNYDTPHAYMQSIGQDYTQISKDMWDYTKAATHGKRAKKVEKKRKELVATTSSALKKVKKMPDYEGNTAYRDSVASYLDMSNHLLNEDYAKIVDLEEIAEQSYDLMEAYLLAKELASEKLNIAGDMMRNEQKAFAKEYNITLLESDDKISKNLEISGKVIKYYNQIYLIFFKSFKQEAYLLDAMNIKDINGVEQNKNALITTSEEGLAKLQKIKSYNADISVKTACKEMLTFYKDEATNKISIVTDYYLKKEEFDKINSAFQAIKESKRTQADVDNYNKAVNDFNDAVNLSNKTNEELNKKRQDIHNKYNKAVDKFMDKHVP